MRHPLLLGLLSLSLLGSAPAAAQSKVVSRNNVDDVRLVSARAVDGVRLHLGETPGDAGSIEVASNACEFIAKDGSMSEFDCTAAVIQALESHAPAVARAPFIYPVGQQGVHDWMKGTSGFGRWETYARVVEIVTATRVSAVGAPSFVGMGFYRVGYPYPADFFEEHYQTPAALQFLDATRSFHYVYPAGVLKEIGRGTRLSDGEPVVFHQFLMVQPENMYRPWFAPGGWAWIAGGRLALKPFATFEADGTQYRNYEMGPVDLEHELELGGSLDFTSNYRPEP